MERKFVSTFSLFDEWEAVFPPITISSRIFLLNSFSKVSSSERESGRSACLSLAGGLAWLEWAKFRWETIRENRIMVQPGNV